jgi:hypothetical protein
MDSIATYGDPALEKCERGGNPPYRILTTTEIRSNGFDPRDEEEHGDYDGKYDAEYFLPHLLTGSFLARRELIVFRQSLLRSEARPLYHKSVRPVEKRKGLPDDPDQWVAECMNGNNATLIQHLKVLQDYVASDEFEGDGRETRRKHYFRMRGLREELRASSRRQAEAP